MLRAVLEIAGALHLNIVIELWATMVNALQTDMKIYVKGYDIVWVSAGYHKPYSCPIFLREFEGYATLKTACEEYWKRFMNGGKPFCWLQNMVLLIDCVDIGGYALFWDCVKPYFFLVRVGDGCLHRAVWSWWSSWSSISWFEIFSMLRSRVDHHLEHGVADNFFLP